MVAICPYDDSFAPVSLHKFPHTEAYLNPFKEKLRSVITFGQTKDDAGRKWFEYFCPYEHRHSIQSTIAFPDITTHNHFVLFRRHRLFKDTAPLVLLKKAHDGFTLAGCLNSSIALFWLKQICFNKGAGEEEQRDRFEYASGKVEQLPVANSVAEALRGKANALAERLKGLSEACWQRGQLLPSLALRKLFEKPGEAYHAWNSSLPGYVARDPALGAPFEAEADLSETYQRAQQSRDLLRAEMVTLQEEMDWLVYAAYCLLPENHPAVCSEAALECGSAATAISMSFASGPRGAQPAGSGVGAGAAECGSGDAALASDSVSKAVAGAAALQGGGKPPLPLDQAQRPFRLWAQAEGDFAKAVSLIPTGWPEWRRTLWEARLAAIRDNEHVRRIEQPVYKRRWDEQWKVRNQWRCGPVAYAAEFVDAFEWWLREKAEWWLEHKKNGGPVDLADWTLVLWQDPRVQAAWPVTAECYALLEYEKAREKAEAEGELEPPRAKVASDPTSFIKAFKRIIDDETVPEGIPWAVPYDDLEKKQKIKIPAKVKSIRGKLNVPRERFHLRGKTHYLWAGLQFR